MPRQFENLTAAELYCPRCRAARPVRERLLLVLPQADLHEYRCAACGESCGTREVKHGLAGAARAAPGGARLRPRAFP
ncbi:MAG TPA: hypothetical protein P5567_09360 [Kiritimatiellia bacterium]|nr:hypothetical protein [Kiritimatiellia bacterium]HRZ12648.1 hypothetical protein [Kiritimatiellia bacterium]HSA19584.1 hypothetical protein [Kiritimatiellia bacterium]